MHPCLSPSCFVQGQRADAGSVIGPGCGNLPVYSGDYGQFRLVKVAGKTCLIDSNGMIDFRQYPELLQLCDGVMLDMKAIDDDFHRQLTGASNRKVLDNLTLLLEAGKLEEVRTVLLPEFSEQNQKTVRGVNERLQGKIRYKLLRYRPFGVCEEGLRFCGRTITPLEEAQRLAQAESDLGFHNCVVI